MQSVSCQYMLVPFSLWQCTIGKIYSKMYSASFGNNCHDVTTLRSLKYNRLEFIKNLT